MFDTQSPITSPSSTQSQILDVVILGAGFSGICAAIKLLEKGINNIKLYDKAAKVGGTWYHNSYPGVACDIPSHLYCYSFEPNPNWSEIYSPGSEIRDYIEHCAHKYGVTPYIEHNMKCESATFNDQQGYWDVHFKDGSRVSCHHIICGTGGLHKPSYPDIPERDSFNGTTMHSATWDHTVDLSNKRVAIIGTAASAIQIIPKIADTVEQLDVYQRTPNYIMPRNNRAYTDKEKQRFKKWPWFARLYRAMIFYKGELLIYPLVKTKEEGKFSLKAKRTINQYMRNDVKDAKLHSHLKPNYSVGCKRILLSDDFFKSLNKANVKLITDGVKAINPNGITTNDNERRDVDVIIYATGFDLEGHMLDLNFIGQNGLSLREKWSKLPEAYQGAALAGFPNLYLTTGPNTGVGTTSVVYMIEKQVDYIMQLIEKAGRTGLLAPKKEAQNTFNETLQSDLQNTVWASNCKSYYKREDGKIVTLYPYNARTFSKRHKHVNWNEFEYSKK